eukprot:CAMPEP_0201545586 /NCGR_PEP_ID=MMETSP0173_2-20130828/2052_1 /ASSEMBLY_ACC=CAM_ASM_000268 /TAXON_ID=218659 /ORGANISM="Vexillifera sp., Strain DIVA3 564/2" /LENGTH=279 /DNA_ID=CAMNT_0047954017 /DNA_START=204 /DNA_END=1040 /DNA_ORIENTATION=-
MERFFENLKNSESTPDGYQCGIIISQAIADQYNLYQGDFILIERLLTLDKNFQEILVSEESTNNLHASNHHPIYINPFCKPLPISKDHITKLSQLHFSTKRSRTTARLPVIGFVGAIDKQKPNYIGISSNRLSLIELPFGTEKIYVRRASFSSQDIESIRAFHEMWTTHTIETGDVMSRQLAQTIIDQALPESNSVPVPVRFFSAVFPDDYLVAIVSNEIAQSPDIYKIQQALQHQHDADKPHPLFSHILRQFDKASQKNALIIGESLASQLDVVLGDW